MTKKDIRDFVPNDPGSDSYVKLWSRIRDTGVVPRDVEFDLTEVISMTAGWPSLRNKELPPSGPFRHFHRFTSAVAAALIAYGNHSTTVRVGNYLARDLIIGADISDREHFDAVRDSLPVLRQSLLDADEPEYPFLSLGSLILAHMASDFDGMAPLASQLIDDDAAVRNQNSTHWKYTGWEFLFGLTYFTDSRRDWLRFCSQIRNPLQDPILQQVLDALAG